MAREPVRSGYSGLKAQVIIGFSLTILAVGIAGYIAFKSTRQLVTALVTLTQPNPKLERLEIASDCIPSLIKTPTFSSIKDILTRSIPISGL
jgi:hypothetical protein